MGSIADFFATYWPLIIVLLVVVVIVAVVRAVRKVLKEGGGAFQVDTARKSTEPNKLWVRQVSKALVADADMICETKGEIIKPTKEDIRLLRVVVKNKFKVGMFLLPAEKAEDGSELPPKVAYFFCKTEPGLQRRLKNLLPNEKRKSHTWPYADIETGKKLKYQAQV